MQNIKILKNLKVAIVVEELTQLGGAERVLDCFLEIFPNAPIYTLVWDNVKTNYYYDKYNIQTSFIQKMPFGVKKYKWYLPLMPLAVESFNLNQYDIIISITSALVKGIKTNKDQIHICYCNTPTRYLWLDSAEYIKHAPIPFFIRPIMPLVVKLLKKWDFKASKRPDYFIANSYNVQKRIKKYYGRSSKVIYPTIDTTLYKPAKKENYFLLVSRIEPYKKVEMVIEAFKDLDDQLLIVGSGSKKQELENQSPKNIKFSGRLNNNQLAKVYAKAKGFIFPQEEDFGLTPIEAMASGTPVIAFGEGGALETVIAGKTGEFFFPQTAKALVKVIRKYRAEKYLQKDLLKQAKKFDNRVFKREIIEYTKSKLSNNSIKN